jgi:thioredoxin 2
MDVTAQATTVSVVCPHCHLGHRLAGDALTAASCDGCGRSLFDGHPAAVSAAEFTRHISETDLPVVVDFWAPWCAPCRMMAPVFETAARELEPQFRFLKVNTDEETDLAIRHGIRAIPTLVVFRGGKEAARISGAMSAPKFIDWVRANA